MVLSVTGSRKLNKVNIHYDDSTDGAPKFYSHLPFSVFDTLECHLMTAQSIHAHPIKGFAPVTLLLLNDIDAKLRDFFSSEKSEKKDQCTVQ
jgi:hypothetical protein